MANYSCIAASGQRLLLIAHTRKSAGNFMKRYHSQKNKFMTCTKK